MKVTYRWLKEYTNFDLSPTELAERLSMIGLNVETMEDLSEKYEGVLVGRVLSCRPHPNTDRLSLCEVDISVEKLSIVCGAPNVAAGQKVPVATVGTKLPSGNVINQTRIRGIESYGMICSESELGLGDDSDTIMVLPESVPVGGKLAEVLELDDVVYDFEITPNRPDCLSVVGIAREISVILGVPLRLPEISFKESSKKTRDLVSVRIFDTEGCPRYTARVIEGVRVGPSPNWLRRRLEAVGSRSINNVVDVTNYVLFELGHPLHAFDLDLVSERSIIVRRARNGEKIVTLDGIERELSEEVLVITDPEKSVGVAGVMGGVNTEVSEQTGKVLLECAYFSPKVIRRGARSLGMSTDASHRFERGVDFDGTLRAINRTAQLIAEIAGGNIAEGALDVYPTVIEPKLITLRSKRIKVILGVKVENEQTKSILTSLGCSIEEYEKKNGIMYVRVPSFRPDLEREIDLIEEIARVFGYDKIPATQVTAGSFSPRISPQEKLKERTREILIGLGLYEVVTSSLIDVDLTKVLKSDTPPICVANPSSPQMSALRWNVLPSLLEVARWNLNRDIENVRIFELGRIYNENGKESPAKESIQLSGLLIGSRREIQWDEKNLKGDFYDVKGIVETYLDEISLHGWTIQDQGNFAFESGLACSILVGDDYLGTLGKVSHQLMDWYDIKSEGYGFILDFEKLLLYSQREKKFHLISRYPAVKRDIAVVLDEEIPFRSVLETIREAGGTTLEYVRLFDVYRGDQIPRSKKSLALSLRFRSFEETLSDREVDMLFKRILDELFRKHGAKLRE